MKRAFLPTCIAALTALASSSANAAATDAQHLYISRTFERSLVVVAALALIYIGFKLLMKGYASRNTAQNVNVKFGSIIDFSLNGFGPGLACIFLGACLALIILMSPITYDANNNPIYYDKKGDADSRATNESEFLVGSKLLKEDCSDKSSDVKKLTYCASILKYRNYLLKSNYEDIISRYNDVSAKKSNGQELSPEEISIYVMGSSMF